MQRALAPRAQRHRAAIERDLVDGLDMLGEMPLDLVLAIGAASRTRPLAAVPVISPIAI